MTRLLKLLAVVLPLLVVGGPHSAAPVAHADTPYEVWIIDQADVARGGARLYIYQGHELEGETYSGTPEVVDLHAAATDVGDGPGVRPHMVLFNSSHSHAVIANVASGHVYVMRAADRTIVASIDVGEQAHAAYPSPDDRMIIVANQNGKRLARIMADFPNETFSYDRAHDLDLKPYEQANNPDNAPICPVLFTGRDKAYVTLRGGGAYVVDVGASPMAVVTGFSAREVAPAGCGGIVTGDRVYVNSGAEYQEGRPGTSSDLYMFDSAGDRLVQHIPYTPLGKDGHGMALVGKYLWMGHRQTGNITVLNTENNTNVANMPNVGVAPDIMDISPSGSHVFVAMRGPNNLTGGRPAKGQTPGVLVMRTELDGASGSVTLFVPIGDEGPETAVDTHSLAVRRTGAMTPAGE